MSECFGPFRQGATAQRAQQVGLLRDAAEIAAEFSSTDSVVTAAWLRGVASVLEREGHHAELDQALDVARDVIRGRL